LKFTKEIKTAIVVLSGILLFIFLYNYFKGQNLLIASRTFYATYSSVEGLTKSAPITINGFNVGSVVGMELTPDGRNVLLTLLIQDDIEFSKNSKAQIYETGLIGGKAVAIVFANDGARPAVSGDTLASEVKDGLTELVNQRLTPLQEKIEKMMVSADDLLQNINDIFDDRTKAHLRGSVARLDSTLASIQRLSSSAESMLASNKSKLNSAFDNAEKFTENLVAISDTLTEADLTGTINRLNQSLTSVSALLEDIEQGKGSVGKILKDEKLYDNIEGATAQLEALLQDMKLNPKRYVHFSLFGKRPKSYDFEKNNYEELNQKQ